jgi:hypothetical protein
MYVFVSTSLETFPDDTDRHTVKLFGHKYHGDGKWTWKIVLENVDEHSEKRIPPSPTPSQLDEWSLYNEMIEEDRRKRSEELGRAEQNISKYDLQDRDAKLARLRASIEEAFRHEQG